MKTVLCYTCIYDIIFITQFLKSNINYKYPQGHRVAPHPHPWETNLGVHLSLITQYTNHTVSFYDIISNSNFIMSNCTMICEWQIGMDVERCDCGLIKVLSWHLHGWTEEKYGKYQSGQPMTWPRFEPGISKYKSRCSCPISLLSDALIILEISVLKLFIATKYSGFTNTRNQE